MAIVKCKECGADVSTKAKTCPNCAAKVPKKISLFTCLVLFFIIFVVVGTRGSTNSPKSATASTISQKDKHSKKVSPSIQAWVTSTSKDEMIGKFSAYAHSPTAYPSKKMSFPYSDVSSWMGVGCDSKGFEWVYFGFSTAPNLTKNETKDGYNLINTRIKWNNQVENVTLTQDWGAKFIDFQRGIDTLEAISRISTSSTALLELHWYGQQPTYFKYSLNGASKAIAEIRAKCALWQGL